MGRPSLRKQLERLYRILDKQWTKGDWAKVYDDEGGEYALSSKNCKFCLVGAARYIVNKDPHSELDLGDAILPALAHALPRQYGIPKRVDPYSNYKHSSDYFEDKLVEWNDKPRRRKKDVLGLITKALKAL